MKEKIKELVKNKYFKIAALILLGLFVLRESYAVYVDMYNFSQLEKAKPYLETIDEKTKDFYNLKEFNERYNAGIKPIKNCYSINTNNGEYFYKFGFKLESLIYIYIYKTRYLAYPKYDTPHRNWCEMGIGCYDKNMDIFKRTISKPCKD